MNSLKLKCIKLHNFKSFLGTHTIDCLNNHLNIITGPNGSGKSNILDAMLFVLGFKAKKLRHTNQADLIHYDSTDKICFVELIFEVFDSDKILLNSQENLTNKLMSKNKIYSVKRELILKNKSIKNTYFLNNQEIKLPDLTTFFKKYLDLENNRFLILQGEIESISLMKPKKTPTSLGMLEYLEEIIGTTFLNDKIEQLTEHINKMKEENERKASEFKFYEKEMKYLEERKEKEEIEEYFSQLELEVKINNLTLKRNNLEIEENEKIILNLENKLKNQKNELNNQEKLKIKEEKKVNSLYKILKEKEEIFLKFNQEKKKKEELINKKNKKEEKINELKKEINELEIKEKEVKKEINEINEKINENNKIIKEIKEEIGKNENKIKKSNELENKKNEINNKINEVNLVIKSKEALINKLNSQKKEKSDFDPKLIDQLKKRLNELENDFEATLKELTKQKINLKESLSYQSNNKVDLMIKNIPGVLGRLSDLGSVEEKYEVAVSAAGKGSLNFIVVNDSSVAEKCAEKVKQMKSKVTFIILDKISEIPDFINSTNDKYLVNLINCDNKIKKCFYFAIKDTLLANDLEEGKKLAYSKERRRVVTLDGKLIEKSGLMCKSIFKKGNLFNKSKKYEKNVNELEKVIQKIKEEIKSVSEQINFNLTKSKQINQSENDQKRIKELKNELTIHQSLFTKLTQQLIKSEKEIEEDKRNLLGKDYNKLINLENKEEELELINQKLKLKKEEIKIQDYSFKLKELTKLQNELKNIPNILLINNDESEKEYKKILKEYELVNKNYLEIKDLFDKLYYERLDLKSMIDNKKRMLNNLREKNCKIGGEVSKGVKEINKINSIINNTRSGNNNINNIDNTSNIENNIDNNIDNIDNNINNNTSNIDNNINNNIDNIDKEIKNLLKKLRKSEIKQIDFDLIEEYFKKNKEFIKIKENYFNYLALLQEKTKELNLSLEKRLTLFKQGLSEINNNLKDVYQTITFGGNAELELVDSLDPFSEGILFSVMPPKKVWRNIRNLSGGERTLASLSLVFALHLYKPSSFYVMDEIDAALDFKNVSIIANFIRERTKDSQFIIISLRNDMFEIGSTFVGVYKNNNKSEVFLINE